MDEAVERAVTQALLSMAQDGVSPDIQEMLCLGDGRGTVPPKVLHRAVRAALQAAIPIIGEEMARVADMHDHRGDVGNALRSHAQHLVGKVGN